MKGLIFPMIDYTFIDIGLSLIYLGTIYLYGQGE